MMNTLTWTSAKGNEMKITAEYTETVKEKIVNADGYEFATGKTEVIINANLTLYVNGKKIDNCQEVNFWQMIDIQVGGKPAKRIWGIEKIGFPLDEAIKIEAFIAEVIEKGKCEKTREIELKKQEDKIKSLENIIENAEAQATVPTRKERTEWERKYNDLHNEGREGYIPYVVCKEEYEAAKNKLNNIKK